LKDSLSRTQYIFFLLFLLRCERKGLGAAYNNMAFQTSAFKPRHFLLLAAAFILLIWYSRRSGSLQLPQSHFSGKDSFDGRWDFTRDAHNLLLTNAQCDQAFPGLFKEIDRAVEHRRHKTITLQEVDDIVPSNGFVRAMIYDQQVC